MKEKIAIYDSSASKELSISKLIEIFKGLGARRVIYKLLSPNDNSKNQPYMGGHLTDLGFFPTGKIIETKSASNKTKNPKRKIKYTTALNYSWVAADGHQYRAPDAKLIYYPQYSKVRFSVLLAR